MEKNIMDKEKYDNDHVEYTFEDIKKLDNALYELALYAATKGKLPVIASPEEHMELYAEVAKKFNEFKSGIQNGEYTFEYIKQFILYRNGPFYQQPYTPDDLITDILEGIKKPKTISKKNKNHLYNKHTNDQDDNDTENDISKITV